MWNRVTLVTTVISEDRIAFINRMERIAELGTMLAELGTAKMFLVR
jgi:hypothetical protein